MRKKILLATGGTGGHIYPAMGLAQQFAQENADVRFIGGGLSQNRYFDKESFPFYSVSCGTFSGKSPVPLFRACGKVLKGIWESRAIIRNFQPHVIVGFGSYYSFPPLVAAQFQSIPIILHEANSIPGKVNKLLAPYAMATGVHFPRTLSLVKGNVHEVGMPLRRQFKKDSVTRSEARRYFGLSNDSRVLLVFGGSQGAQIINTRVMEALNLETAVQDGKVMQDFESDALTAGGDHSQRVKAPPAVSGYGSKDCVNFPSSTAVSRLKSINLGMEVIHITGDGEQIPLLKQAYSDSGIHACVKAFEGRMEMAWQAADCVISRAGAGSIAEQLEFEVPGILIPFARAADNHQNDNADFLVDVVCGARKLQEHSLNAQTLRQQILDFLSQDSDLLLTMKSSMRNYKNKTRTRDLYALINELVF